jgi:hypothetical protein
MRKIYGAKNISAPPCDAKFLPKDQHRDAFGSENFPLPGRLAREVFLSGLPSQNLKKPQQIRAEKPLICPL